VFSIPSGLKIFHGEIIRIDPKNISLFQYSLIPCGWHKLNFDKNPLLSLYCRIAATSFTLIDEKYFI